MTVIDKYAIKISNLILKYQNSKTIDDLSLSIPESSIFGLIGPNGAGKTTLIKIIMGIIKPDCGEISILGADPLKKGPQIRNRIGYVPDYPHMYNSFTCQEMFRLSSKLYSNWDWARCRQLTELFEIPTDKKIKNLSRGFKSRTSLVIALSIRPRLLILDEPANAIDPLAREKLRQVMIDEVTQNNTTVFYSTHDLNELERTADHIAVIENGHLLFQRPVDEIKESIHLVRMTFNHDQPFDGLERMAGLIQINKYSRGCTILLEGDWNEVESTLYALGAQNIERLDVSLEETITRLLKKGGQNEKKVS